MRDPRQSGSVVLVALSCVTVLGIAMASFLSISNQAMKLSNRTYAKAVSKQLAEMGLERALISYNDNSFDTWTRPDLTTATASFSIPSDRYGRSGITAAVNVRVDHYRATRKATPWSVLTTYAVNDFVWYQGVWYSCTAAPPANEAPSFTAYWTAAPELWNAYANYRTSNIVLSGGSAYRCIADNINQTPPNASYWTAYSVAAWVPSLVYTVDTVVLHGGIYYRCVAPHFGQTPPNTTYWLSAPVIYAEGVATLPDSSSTAIKTQLRAMLAPAPLFPNALGAQLVTNLTSTGTVDSYNQVLGSYNQTTAPFSAANPNRGSSAVVAGGKTTGTAVAITRVRVNGYVAAPSSTTAPYNPRYTYNTTSGIITSTLAPTTPSPKIDLTRVSRSPYIPKFDIQSVAAGAPTFNVLTVADLVGATTDLPRGGIDTVNAADGKYYYYTDDSIVLDSGSTININDAVVIDIRPATSGDLDIQGTGKITIANNLTASLEIHFDDRLYIYSDNAAGGIDNQTMDPKRLILIGSQNNNASGYHYLRTSVNNTFYGVIYMPYAYLHVRNTSRTQTIYGAISAETIYFDDSTTVHYDTSLRTATFSGVDAPYRISEWRELTDPNDKITLP